MYIFFNKIAVQRSMMLEWGGRQASANSNSPLALRKSHSGRAVAVIFIIHCLSAVGASSTKCLDAEKVERVWEKEVQRGIVKFYEITSKE